MSNGDFTSRASPGPEQQDAPLTENERHQVNRLLSDPTYFPIEFRTWLKNYIEGGGLTFPASSIIGGGGDTTVNLPIGSIIGLAAASTAKNILPCDGREVVVDEYKKLAAFLGNTWGVPSAGKVKLPDFRDRALYGAGSAVGLGATDGRGIGSRGGPRHYHSFSGATNQTGNHDHGVNTGASGSGTFSGSVSGSVGGGGGHDHGPAGGGGFAKNSGETAQGAGGTAWTRYNVVNYTTVTDYEGDHGHGWSGSVSGSVGVSVSISVDVIPAGDHTHSVSGSTSGGFGLDTPSFAGIHYYIVVS